MTAIQSNAWKDGRRGIGESMPRSRAILAVSAPEHYLPLLHVLARRPVDGPVTSPVERVDGGSVSMLSVRIG